MTGSVGSGRRCGLRLAARNPASLHPTATAYTLCPMPEPPQHPTARTRILGIDPGTRTLGYGILDVGRSGQAFVVHCGALRLPPRPLEVRLEAIFREVSAIITRHRPRILAIEEVFHGKNFQSVLKVGEARGVVVLAAQMAGLEICEYAPAVIKKAATGNGVADKAQVQRMMARLLGLRVPPEPEDVTDALAAAFCHGQRIWRSGVLDAVSTKRGTSKGGASKRNASKRGARSRAPGGGSKKTLEERRPIDAVLRAGKARVFRGSRFRRVPTQSSGG